MAGDKPVTGDDTMAQAFLGRGDYPEMPRINAYEFSLTDVVEAMKKDYAKPDPDWLPKHFEEAKPGEPLITDPIDRTMVSGGYGTEDGKTVITLRTKDNTFEPPVLLDKSGKPIDSIAGGGGGGGGGGDDKNPPPPPEDGVEYRDGSRIDYTEGESKLRYTDPSGKTSEIQLNEPLVKRK
ncbi:MAG: hypothetical protein KC777_18440 [Cyanobacteria bacterium HKST-UBA02]|nr:hypothetical protein [Cyanobacteria bacterium HKST-UBA02]